MNIPKAIEELTDLHKVGLNRLTPDEKDALKLGIEALKRVNTQRLFPSNVIWETLPGETED